MHILMFLRSLPPHDLRRLVTLAAVSGLADSLLLAVSGSAAKQVATGIRPEFTHTVLYLSLFILSYVTLRHTLRVGSVLVEDRLRHKREGLVDQIRRVNLVTVEAIGQSRLFQLLTDEIKTISQLFPTLLSTLQDLVLLVMGAGYLAYLSLRSTLIIAVITGFVLVLYRRVMTQQKPLLASILEAQTEMVGKLEAQIKGFKSLRLHQAKNQKVFETTTEVSQKIESAYRRVGRNGAAGSNLTTLYIHLSLGFLVFILPHFDAAIASRIPTIVAAVLFLLGPLSSVVGSMNLVMQLEAGLGALTGLEIQLSQAGSEPVHTEAHASTSHTFERIEYRGITFHHRDDSGETAFTSGPWDFILQPGELVFVVGGNGSGKSTFLQLLCGLYSPDAGTVCIDEVALRDCSQATLRERFGAVFSDFHLFDRFYGRESVDSAVVNGYLKDLELTHKVQFKDGAFSTLNLSTGQRKRLALAAALVDDKPIYIFDEWTADQDATFRERFYREILPSLKALGKTCIVVTHDDRYWSFADRLVRLDLGKIVHNGAPDAA